MGLFLTVRAQNYSGPQEDIDQILQNIQDFSKYLIAGDTDKLVNCYTKDGKIFPSNRPILEGHRSLMMYWTPSEGSKVHTHLISPLEIKVTGDEAYDYGYYEGSSSGKDGEIVSWKGKYVILWKKIDGQWKMYVDIWNRVKE